MGQAAHPFAQIGAHGSGIRKFLRLNEIGFGIPSRKLLNGLYLGGLGQTDTANFQQMVQRSRQHAANTPKLRKQTAGQLDGIFSGHPAHQANT
jgi:hypothetical protein